MSCSRENLHIIMIRFWTILTGANPWLKFVVLVNAPAKVGTPHRGILLGKPMVNA